MVCEVLMSFSDRFCSGFALAATIAGDPGAELARAGLHEPAREPVTRVAREWLGLSKTERRARVSALARPPRGAWPRDARAPLRAYALLAAMHHREAAASLPAFLRTAPLPRPGFTPEPGLLMLLQRLAFSETPEGGSAVAEQTSAPQPPRDPATGKGEPWGA